MCGAGVSAGVLMGWGRIRGPGWACPRGHPVFRSALAVGVGARPGSRGAVGTPAGGAGLVIVLEANGPDGSPFGRDLLGTCGQIGQVGPTAAIPVEENRACAVGGGGLAQGPDIIGGSG